MLSIKKSLDFFRTENTGNVQTFCSILMTANGAANSLSVPELYPASSFASFHDSKIVNDK